MHGELYHAFGYGFPHPLSGEEAIRHAGRHFQFGQKVFSQQLTIRFRLIRQDRPAEQVGGAQSVIQTFSRDGIGKASRISDHGPAVATDRSLPKSRQAECGKDMRVKLGAREPKPGRGDAFFH